MALDLLGVGISSLAEVEEGPPPRRLNLHMNRISDLAGLGRFARLEELILSANCITSLRCEHFQEQGQLKLLDLSCNQLQGLSGLQPLRALRELRVAYNQVQSLEGLQSFWGRQYELKVLDLRCNRIAGLPQLLFLGGCCKLEALRFKEGGGKENPICAETMYSSSVLMAAPWLQTLDGAPAQEAAEPKPAPAPAPEQSAKEELRRRELEQAGAELRAAQREAQLAEEQAMAAQNAAEEAAHRRAMQGAAREARLKADLEEIVQAVQKHEAHFAQELSKLEAADAELPAAQAAASAQEAQLRLEEQRCRELSSSEALEISLAASWKSERDAAEQMLTLWRQKSSTLPTYDVSALQRELLLTSEQLQETRRHLGDLPSLAEELREQEQRVLDARRDAREQECVARSWNLEAAAVAGRLASIRGAAAQSARAGAEMLDAAELQCKNYQESLAESLAEESMLRKEVDLQSRPEIVQEGSLHWLLAERERLQAEVQERQSRPRTPARQRWER
ncbi:unnamed protein product [Effrenium voratum]|nr:unnamed protein product [Effrenium voratum]